MIKQDYQDRESHDSGSDSDGSTDTDQSVSNDLDDVIEDLETDVQLLMELDRFIHAPSATIPAKQENEYQALVTWQPQDAFAHIIRNRFPAAVEGLVEALAKANLDRLHRCHEARETNAENPNLEDQWITQTLVKNAPERTDAGETRNDSGYGTMSAVSDRASLRLAQSQYAETVMSYAAGDRTIKIPPLSADAKAGRPFICVACGKSVRFTRSRMWK